MINVQWSNRLATLATELFRGLHRDKSDAPADVFRYRHCVIVPNRITQYWLQHQYIYTGNDQPEPRVLTDIDYPLLHIFVNDWLHRMDHPDETRDPAAHPFSVEALRWRIYRLLEQPGFLRAAPELARYVNPPTISASASRPADRRRFKLAGRLARLCDEYMVYRPETLTRWEQNDDTDVPPELAWEPLLWRELVKGGGDAKTYLDAFRRLITGAGLKKVGIENHYREIHLFGVSMMPRIYLWFFERLSECLPVLFYLFNPCQTDWFDDRNTDRQRIKQTARARKMEAPDAEPDPTAPSPNRMLGTLGVGCGEFLTEVLDITGGQSEAGGRFTEPERTTLLQHIQADILDNQAPTHNQEHQEQNTRNTTVDASIQIHVCHGPLREVEILHDNILKWFAQNNDLQPRDIQVQVTDMATYAPCIDAVFAARTQTAPAAIPYAVADRVLAGESRVAGAFMNLIGINESRFTAPDVFALLNCEGIAQTFGFQPGDIAKLAGWIEKAGVRWGYDETDRESVSGVNFTDYTTWRRGLDRLLLGHAMGSAAAADGIPLPCDCVEGDDAVMLGRLAHFVVLLNNTASLGDKPRTAAEWQRILNEVIDVFFTSTNDNYRDIGALRAAADALGGSALAAEFTGKIPLTVIREFLAGHFKLAAGGGDISGNVVIFSALRAGSSVPRRITCLLGMNDGQYPRPDNRAAYDLLRLKRKVGDRSQKIEDRLAWLEALTSARDVLYISYTGFDCTDIQTEIPPSVLVQELREQAVITGNNKKIPEIRHKLRAFDPIYFTDSPDTPLTYFSYSRSNFEAARRLTAGISADDKLPANAPSPGATPVSATENTAAGTTVPELELTDLIRFFTNPAERYYRDILGVELVLKPETALNDTEEFDAAGLPGYMANQVIVEALLDMPADNEANIMNAALNRLWEEGLIPLEYWGASWFKTQWANVRTLLDAEIDGLGRIGEAIRRQRAAENKILTVLINPDKNSTIAQKQHLKNNGGRRLSTGSPSIIRSSTPLEGEPAVSHPPPPKNPTPVLISGASALFNLKNGGTAALDFRCASPKPANRLACWIRHLFACAAEQPSTRFYIESKDPARKDSPVRFDPVDASEAQSILGAYMSIYRAGRDQIPPFTPATAFEYVRKLQDDNALAAELTSSSVLYNPEALEKARGRWYSGSHKYGDDQDPYFLHAFGPDGPFAEPSRFSTLATVLFTPLFTKQIPLEVRHE